MKKILIIGLILLMGVLSLAAAQNAPDPDPHRFDKEINSFKQWDQKNSFVKNAILFVGSSSTRLWLSQDAFPEFPVINRGFGGAHISDINYFIQESVVKYHAPIIVFYCGDNDVADNKPAEQVLQDYHKFVTTVAADNPDVKIIFIPIKPSIARWAVWPEMKRANQLIADYSIENENLFYVDTATPMIPDGKMPAADLFVEDGLHLSARGYALWNKLLRPALIELTATALAAPQDMKMEK